MAMSNELERCGILLVVDQQYVRRGSLGAIVHEGLFGLHKLLSGAQPKPRRGAVCPFDR